MAPDCLVSRPLGTGSGAAQELLGQADLLRVSAMARVRGVRVAGLGVRA